MKKITYLLIAAITLVSVASCVKEQMETFGPDASFGTEITVALAPGTRTDLLEGKTVWAEGDQLLVSNGAAVDTIDVPEEAFGLSAFSFKTQNATPTEANPDVFVVYPATAAGSFADGKIVVKVPGVQDGTFAAANICAGKSDAGTVALKNVTGILKVNVPAEAAAPVYQLVFSAVGDNALSGELTVDFVDGAPVVTAAKTSSSVTVQAGGFDGDFFAAVIPGTYDAGFKMTAATVSFEHASETKVSTVANEVKINEIVDLGVIGSDLKPLEGEGTEASPYLIENLGHMIALATAVDNGDESQDFAGQYFKVAEDISGVSIPIGSTDHPFCGTLDGNGKTITLNMSGAQAYMGLFSSLSHGANVSNLVIDGKISSNANYAGGVVGYVVASKDSARIQISNITNKAVISGVNNVAGIAGRTAYTDVYNCTNNGEIEGDTGSAGIVAYCYYSTVSYCTNMGTITGKKDCGKVVTLQAGAWGTAMSYLDGTSGSTYSSIPTTAIGGITAWAQNSTVDGCDNHGAVNGISKAGGVTGACYWSTVKNCKNSAAITAEKDFVGGIIGWFFVSGNSLNNTNSATVTGRAAVGGIVGLTNGSTSNSVAAVKECHNLGDVISTGKTAIKHYNNSIANASAAGGIVGLAIESSNGSNRGVTQITSCVNDGSVTGEGVGVAGILGVKTAFLNSVQTGFIDRCVNNGAIESKLYRAAGILGQCWERFTSTKFTVRNSANHGTIKAPYVVAGIVSWMSHLYPDANSDKCRECIFNCYNDGTILYDKSAYADGSGPYAGGILGYSQATSVYNVVNYGDVKPIEGEPNEYDVKYYAIDLAFLGKRGLADYLYGTDGDLPLVGPNAGDPASVVGAIQAKILEDGSLDKAVTIEGTPCEFPVDALNKWVTAVAEMPEDKPDFYLLWKDGAKGPVFDE